MLKKHEISNKHRELEFASNVSASDESISAWAYEIWSTIKEDEFVEIRMLPPKDSKLNRLHGAYDDLDKIIRTVQKESGKYQIYFGLNPRLKSAIPRGQSLNELYSGAAYNKDDVSRIKYFLIDFDPSREANLAATETELALAKGSYEKCNEFLKSKGISAATAMSGNGYHIIIRTIDYPISVSERGGPIRKILVGLSEKFSTPAVKVDISVFDAPRICKFYGAKSIKGTSSEDRPHRFSFLTSEVELTDEDILEKLKFFIEPMEVMERDSNFKTENKLEKVSIRRKFNVDPATIDILDLFKKSGLYVKASKNEQHIVLCPFRDKHSDDTDGTTTTVVFEQTSQRNSPGFKCFHAHCSDKTIIDVLEFFGRERIDLMAGTGLVKECYARPTGFNLMTLRELIETPDEKNDWLVDQRFITAGVSLIAGKPKVGKTTLIRDLVFCVASGRDWLGFKTNKAKVCYLALEEKKSEIKKHFIALGATGSENILVHADIAPQNAKEDLKSLIEDNSIGLLIIDPIARLGTIGDLNDYSKVYSYFESIIAVARQTGCHIICAHHMGKGDRSEESDGILGSTGFFAAVDAAYFLTRQNGARVIHSDQRYGRNLEKSVVLFDEKSRSLSLTSYSGFKDQGLRDAILRVLEKGSQNVTDIQKIVKANKSHLLKELNFLGETGEIQCSKRGNEKIWSLVVPALEKVVENDRAESVPKTETEAGTI